MTLLATAKKSSVKMLLLFTETAAFVLEDADTDVDTLGRDVNDMVECDCDMLLDMTFLKASLSDCNDGCCTGDCSDCNEWTGFGIDAVDVLNDALFCWPGANEAINTKFPNVPPVHIVEKYISTIKSTMKY
jgi:hypothetical protein